MKKILHTIIFIIGIHGLKLSAQPCELVTPVFTVNLTGNPNGSWISPSIQRDGYCCSASGSDVCIEFVLTLDPAANGILFDIASGAVPPGALYYQINCGPPIMVGLPICLTGAGPHLITFCKPGNNQNSYSITSIQEPNVTTSVSNVASPSCPATVGVQGLVPSTISWTAVPYNTQYDNFLSCINGCDTVTATPSGIIPSYVDYQVCGDPYGGCSSGIFCDTVRVSFLNDVSVNITPPGITLCNGISNTVLTANASGGSGVYRYAWSNGDMTQSINAGAGIYSVIVSDSVLCSTANDAVMVSVLTPIIANAGSDITICASQSTVNLNGSIQTATGGIWTGGSGTYNPNNSTLNAVYIPSANEINNGFADLLLVTTGNHGCPGDSDAVHITIAPLPSPSISGNILLCANSTAGYSTPLVPGDQYSWVVSGGTISGSSNSNSINVTWGNSGSGAVTVTQTNASGCSASLTQNVSIVTLPNPVIAGSNSICQFSTPVYSVNSTPGSIYVWTSNNGTINGSNTNPSIDVTWNSYGSGSVTVVETNSYGCTQISTLPVTILQRPVPAIAGAHSGCANNESSTYSSPLYSNTSYSWSVTGGNIVSVNGINSVNIIWNTTGSNSVSLTVINNSTGCDSTVVLGVDVGSLNPIVVQAGVMSGCPPLTVGFTGNIPATGQSYSWTFGDALYSSSATPTHIYEEPGTYNVILVTQSESGCADTVMGTVHVFDVPQSLFTHNYEGTNYIIGESTLHLVNSTTGGSSYLWTFGTLDTSNVFEPPYTYDIPGDYTIKLFAYSSSGCVDVSYKEIHVRNKEHIYIPNAFSPNGDNMNDFFAVETTNISNLKILIFNRWGSVFYSSEAKDFKWDGTYHGNPVELGVYGYIIKALGDGGSDYTFNGTFTLVR